MSILFLALYDRINTTLKQIPSGTTIEKQTRSLLYVLSNFCMTKSHLGGALSDISPPVCTLPKCKPQITSCSTYRVNRPTPVGNRSTGSDAEVFVRLCSVPCQSVAGLLSFKVQQTKAGLSHMRESPVFLPPFYLIFSSSLSAMSIFSHLTPSSSLPKWPKAESSR